MVDTTVEKFGRLDYACNAAGLCVPGTSDTATTAEFDLQFQVNARGIWLCQQAEINQMTKQSPLRSNDSKFESRGAIVNVASMAGLLGLPNLVAYGASKHAVIGLTKSNAMRHGADLIRINAVCPGAVQTPMLGKFAGDKVDEVRQTLALQREALPEEIAECITTPEQVEKTTRCGVQAWSTRGIVGRGVLLDYWSYARKSYDVNTRHPISADDLKACANAQGVKFQYGDILLVRTGWIETYNNMSQEERVKLTEVPAFQHTFVGVDQHPDVADFLHDNYFSVVASDTPAFEVWPQVKEWNHHSNLLPLWGVPIGELWDLERLAEVCKERKQYEFFFASTPMNVKGEFCVMAYEFRD
ncbi:hypothetical protein ACJ41O_013207 [Fusarium nematophilum]